MQKIKIPVKKQNLEVDELDQLEKMVLFALNFRVEMFYIEGGKYQCRPADTRNVFAFWYLEQKITKNSAIAACFYLITQYQQFMELDPKKRDKIVEAQTKHIRVPLLPQFNCLPINAQSSELFKQEYQKKRQEQYIQNNMKEYVTGDDTFAEQLTQMGYHKLDTNTKIIFRIPNSPEVEIEFIDSKIKIGVSEPKFLAKTDLTILEWFGRLTLDDRKFFLNRDMNIASLESIKYHLDDQMRISAQLRNVKDLNLWATDRYERSKRVTNLFLTIMNEKYPRNKVTLI